MTREAKLEKALREIALSGSNSDCHGCNRLADTAMAALEIDYVTLEMDYVASLRKADGMVEIQGDMHLFECEKRKDEKNPCNCGSTQVGSCSAQKESNE